MESVMSTAGKRGFAAIVMIVPLLMLMPQAAAQQGSSRETQNGVVVLRGSGPPATPNPLASRSPTSEPGSAAAAPGSPTSGSPKPLPSYCDALARSNRPRDRQLHDTICGSH